MKQLSKHEILNRVYNMGSGSEACKEIYSQWAATYDDDTVGDMGYVAPTVVAEKLSSLVENTATVLDAGCGTGLAGVALKERGFSTIDGLDLSQEMLDLAKEKSVYRSLECADLTVPLSHADGSYDAVVCVGTFTHGHVGPETFFELLRVTRPQGVVVATVHEDIWGAAFEDALKAVEANGAGDVVSVEDAPYHVHDCKLCVLKKRRAAKSEEVSSVA